MDCARSGVAVMEEMIKSILPPLSEGMSPSNAMFWMRSSGQGTCRAAFAMSTLTPVGLPFSSVISNGGY